MTEWPYRFGLWQRSVTPGKLVFHIRDDIDWPYVKDSKAPRSPTAPLNYTFNQAGISIPGSPLLNDLVHEAKRIPMRQLLNSIEPPVASETMPGVGSTSGNTPCLTTRWRKIGMELLEALKVNWQLGFCWKAWQLIQQQDTVNWRYGVEEILGTKGCIELDGYPLGNGFVLRIWNAIFGIRFTSWLSVLKKLLWTCY